MRLTDAPSAKPPMLPVLTSERLDDLVRQADACDSTRALDDLLRRVMRDYKRNRGNAEPLTTFKTAIASRRSTLNGAS